MGEQYYQLLLLFFFMNYQQYRTITASNSLPALQSISSLPECYNLTYQHGQPADHQKNSGRFFHKPIQPPKQPFTVLKSEFQFSKTSSQPSGPLNFSLSTPQKLKAKKTGRPMAKISHRSQIAMSPQQFGSDFLKEENQMTRTELSRTTGELYPLQVDSEPPLGKQNMDASCGHSKRSLPGWESKSKMLDLPVFDSSSSNNLVPGQRKHQFLLEASNTKRMEIQSFQGEIIHLYMESRPLGGKEERARRNDESERTQLQLKVEQNSKLLIEIELMEKELKGKQELNRYLEHQCRYYDNENKALKETTENSRKELERKDEAISALHREVDHLEQRLRDQGQVQSELNRTVEAQRESIQQMQKSSDLDKSEICVLRVKIEALQKKYQQLMGSILETQKEATIKQQRFAQERRGIETRLQELESSKEELESSIRVLVAEGRQLLQSRQEAAQEVVQLKQVLSEREALHSQFQKQHQHKQQQWAQSKELLQNSLEELQREAQQQQKASKLQIEKLQKYIEADSRRQVQYQQILKVAEQKQIQITKQLLQAQEGLKNKDRRISILQDQSQAVHQRLKLQINQLINCQHELDKAQKQSTTLVIKSEKQRDEFERQFRDLNSSLFASEKEKQGWREESLALRERVSHLEANYESLRESNDELEALHCEVLSRSCSYVNINHQLEGMYSVLQAQYLQVSDRLKQIQEERDSLKCEINLLSIRSREKEGDLASMRQANRKGLEELSILEDELAALRQENKLVGQEKKHLEGLIAELRREISSLLLIVQENEKRYGADIKTRQQAMSDKEREIVSLTALFEEVQSNLQAKINQLISSHSADNHLKLAQLHSRDEAILKMEETIGRLVTRLEEQAGCKDSTAIEVCYKSSQSLESFCSEESDERQQVVSMGNLGEGQVCYIEMDREGIHYLCELLAIEPASGNLLNQIVAEVENIRQRYQKETYEILQYRQLLSEFGVEVRPTGLRALLIEVVAAKEHLGLLVGRLAEEERRSEILQREKQELAILQNTERDSRICYEKEERVLISELNEEIMRLNARLANQRGQLREMLSIASDGCTSRPKHDVFVTAHSFELLGE